MVKRCIFCINDVGTILILTLCLCMSCTYFGHREDDIALYRDYKKQKTALDSLPSNQRIQYLHSYCVPESKSSIPQKYLASYFCIYYDTVPNPIKLEHLLQLKSEYINHKLGDFLENLTSLQLAILFKKVGHYNTAMNEYRNALEYFGSQAENFPKEAADCNEEIGYICLDIIKNKDSAIYYYNRAIQICEQYHLTFQLAKTKANLASIYGLDTNTIDKANALYHESKQFFEQGNDSIHKEIWIAIVSKIILIYGKKGIADSCNYYFEVVNSQYRKGRISKAMYSNFLFHSIPAFFDLKQYDIIQSHLNFLLANAPKELYINLGILRIQFYLAFLRGEYNVERKHRLAALKLINPENLINEYYYEEYLSTLNRLIQIDSTMQNYEAMNEWYRKKISVKENYIQTAHNYTKQSDMWAKRELELIEITAELEKKRRIQLQFIVVFISGGIALLSILFWNLWKLNKRLKDNRSILEKQKEELILNQEQLNQLSEQLIESNENLDRFASIAAHDLRSPLVTIKSYADIMLMQDTVQNPTDRAYLTKISESVMSMSRMIQQFLQLSKFNTDIPKNKINTNEVLHIVIQNLAKQIEQSNAKINVPTPLPMVYGSFEILEQIFQNLIDNSIKYAELKRDPMITISATKLKHSVVITYQDNGRGIEKNFLDRIFSPFSKLNEEQEDSYGIGLFTCKKLVHILQGTISVESELHIGTRFILSFPSMDS